MSVRARGRWMCAVNERSRVAVIVKKFYADTAREALRLVRDALGADAMILGNRRTAGGVEIMAVAPSGVRECHGGRGARADERDTHSPPPSPRRPSVRDTPGACDAANASSADAGASDAVQDPAGQGRRTRTGSALAAFDAGGPACCLCMERSEAA